MDTTNVVFLDARRKTIKKAVLHDPLTRYAAARIDTKRHRLRGAQASILRHVAFCDDGHGCATSLRTYDREFGIGRRTAIDALKALVARGLLHRVDSPRGDTPPTYYYRP